MAKKILIVDDEENVLNSMKLLVKSMGYEVKTAKSGKQALGLLKKKKFDLVLLDILMPEMSGREVLEKIRADAKLKDQKVAFLTVVRLGKEGKDMIEELKSVDYFQKPIDIKNFKRRLKKILG